MNNLNISRSLNIIASHQLSIDAVALFSKTRSGHMGLWQYQEPLYEGDPAGGSALWAKFIKNSRTYYPYTGDIELIANSSNMLFEVLKGVSSLVELGPGSKEAILNKTLSVLSQTPQNTKYIAADCDLATALQAADLVNELTGRVTKAELVDGLDIKTLRHDHPLAIMILGSTITNLEGSIGQPYHLSLQKMVQALRSSLRSGDKIIATFDTNVDEASLLEVYGHEFQKRFGESAIHLIARECEIEGNFDPQMWRYKTIFTPETRQISHCVYPLVDQAFALSGHKFFIPANELLVMNNSYKYRPSDVELAFRSSGLNAQTLRQSNNRMAMIIGQVT